MSSSDLSDLSVEMLDALDFYVADQQVELVAVLQAPANAPMFRGTIAGAFTLSKYEGRAAMVEELADEINVIRNLPLGKVVSGVPGEIDLGDGDVTSVASALIEWLRRFIPAVPDFDVEPDKTAVVATTGSITGAIEVVSEASGVMADFIESDRTQVASSVVTPAAMTQAFRDSIGNRLPESFGYWEEGR